MKTFFCNNFCVFRCESLIGCFASLILTRAYIPPSAKPKRSFFTGRMEVTVFFVYGLYDVESSFPFFFCLHSLLLFLFSFLLRLDDGLKNGKLWILYALFLVVGQGGGIMFLALFFFSPFGEARGT